MSETQHQEEQRLIREDIRLVRAAAAQLLVPAKERAATEPRVPELAAIETACDLYMIAFTMKPSARSAGICIADEAAERMGLSSEDVHDLTLARLAAVDAQSRSSDRP